MANMLSTVCGMSERFNNCDCHFLSSCPLALTMVQRQDIALANYQSYATGTSWVTYTRALICHSLAEEIMLIPISQIRKLKFRAALGFGLQGLCLPHSTWTLTFFHSDGPYPSWSKCISCREVAKTVEQGGISSQESRTSRPATCSEASISPQGPLAKLGNGLGHWKEGELSDPRI